MKPKGYSIIAVDPGGSTGLAWACIGRSELKRLGAVGALQAAKKDNRFLGEEVTGANEFDQAAYILAWVEMLQGEAARRSRGAVRGHERVVIEDFILRERTKDRSLLAPVRLTAMVEFGLWSLGQPSLVDGKRRPPLYPPAVVRQQPSDAKSVATDERLKRWDLWYRGSPHVRDATRHLIVYLRRNEQRLIDGK